MVLSILILSSNRFYLQVIGKKGKVLEVDKDGDVVIQVKGRKWYVNPACLTYLKTESGDSSSDSDDEDDDDCESLSFTRFSVLQFPPIIG